VLTDLAQAVTDEMNEAFGTSLTAVRKARPTWKLEQLATLQCAVSRRRLVKRAFNRAVAARTVTIAINLAQQIRPISAAEATEQKPAITEDQIIDNLDALVESIVDH
jgi:hypothetical protein